MLKSFLNELFSEHMKPILRRAYTVDDISRVRIFSHSGGYYTIGSMATVGGMPNQVLDLCLLDSLYADFSQFDNFVVNHLASFGVGASQFRFSSVYTLDGGTYNNNMAMESRAKQWVIDGQCENVLYIDNSYPQKELSNDVLSSYSLVFKYTSLSHNDVPRNYFHDFLVGAV